MVEIRKAVLKDVSNVSEIVSILDTDKYRFSDIKAVRSFVSNGWFFVAVENGNMLGVISLEPTEGSYQMTHVVSKRKGFGKLLIKFAIDKYKKEKISKLWGWSLKRYNAKGFYKKVGFDEIFLLKKQWYGEDCYFFGKIIR